MQNRQWLMAGAIAAMTFFSLVFVLALSMDGYSHISRTVSEIGRQGSPAELPWRVGNLIVAALLMVFAAAIGSCARERAWSRLPALFIALFAVSLAGTGWFAVPHPLHNVFGLSATVGYLSPLVLALAWRGNPVPHALTTVSAVAWLLVTAAIALNLSPLFAPTLYPLEYYGLVQRALFLALENEISSEDVPKSSLWLVKLLGKNKHGMTTNQASLELGIHSLLAFAI